MLEWFASLTQVVFSIGYFGVYLALFIEALGLPFPGDAAMAFYGFAAAKGEFHVVPIIVCSILGYMSGAIVCYWLSRAYGWKLFDTMTSRIPMLNQRSMMRTTNLMQVYGPVGLVVGRFLPGVRSVSSYAAGMYRMELRPFIVYTVLGVIAWCAAWIFVGYWFGEHIKFILQAVQSWLFYLTAAIILFCSLLWFWRRHRHGRVQ